MIHFTKVDAEADREVLLHIHCEVNYACDSHWAVKVPYEEYSAKWLSTSQPNAFLSHLAETMKDPRTIADFVINEHGERVGFVWVVFHDIVDYQLTAAEIMDFYIFPEHRRKGIGFAVLQRIEKEAKRRGANLLRSETGIENSASISLHQKIGFEAYRMSFEKRL